MSSEKRNGKVDPKQDPLSIGNLAIQRGYATLKQVQEAARKQEARLPLGEILIEDGVLTSAQLEELLMEQEVRRKHMNEHAAAKFVQKKRREKMKEVTASLKMVATSLQFVMKN